MSDIIVDLDDLLTAALPPYLREIIERARAELAAERERLLGVGANRYWEGRWRDEREWCAQRVEAVLSDHDPQLAEFAAAAIRKGEP